MIEIDTSIDDALIKKFLETLESYTFIEKYELKEQPIHQTKRQLSELERIKARIPKVDHEYLPNGETNPLDINFNDAISDQKGCYPGQEVIEKIIALGAPPKQLCLLHSEKVCAIPTKLKESAGIITSIAMNNNEIYALGIIRKTHAHTGYELYAENGDRFEIIEVKDKS